MLGISRTSCFFSLHCILIGRDKPVGGVIEMAVAQRLSVTEFRNLDIRTLTGRLVLATQLCTPP